MANGILCLPALLVPVALSRQVPETPQLSLVRPGETAAVTGMCVQATRPAKPMVTAQGSEPRPKEVTGPLESISPGPLLLRVKIRRWYVLPPPGEGDNIWVSSVQAIGGDGLLETTRDKKIYSSLPGTHPAPVESADIVQGSFMGSLSK